MDNKRGVMAFGTVFFLGALMSIIVISQFTPYQTTLTIGDKQSAALQAYAEGEFVKDYLSRAAELSLESSMSELGQTGGYPNEAPCGTTDSGFSIWTDCAPSAEELEDTFSDLFTVNFINYLLAHPAERGIPAELFALDDVLRYEYDGSSEFKIETSPVSVRGYPEKELIGVPVVNESGDVNLEPFETEVAIEIHDLGQDVVYVADSYFSSELNLDLNGLYTELITAVGNFNTACISNQDCRLSSESFSYSIGYSGNVAEITATYPYKVPIYEGSSVKYRNLEFKFALLQ